MPGEGALGEAVLDLNADASTLRASMGEAKNTVQEALESITEIVGTGTVAIIASIAALGAGILVAMKIGLDATLAWSRQLDTLNDVLGLSGEDASALAVAMGTVGLNVEEGIGQISIFVRNLDASRTASQQAAEQYATALSDLTQQHLDTLQQMLDDKELADEESQARIEQIESDLADAIVKINAGLQKQLKQMLRDRNKEIADEAKAELQIQKDAEKALTAINVDEAKSLAALKKSTDKSLADIDKDTRSKLKGTLSQAQRQQILDEADARKQDLEEQRKEKEQQILEDAQARRDAIAEQRQERMQDLAERKAAAKEEYEYRVALQKQAAEDQIKAAGVAAEKQTTAIEKAFEKQERLYEKRTEKENERSEAQLKKLNAQLDKASESNPMAKALKKLGVDALDAAGDIRPISELLPEIMDAFKAFPKGPEASAIALQLFGRGGGKFLDFLRQGSEGLKTASDEAKAWGLITSTEDVDAAEQFEFSLNKLNLMFTGVKKAIGDEVLPVVIQLVSAFTDGLRDNMPSILSAVKQFFDWLTPKLQVIGEAFGSGNWAAAAGEIAKIFGEIMGKINEVLTKPESQKALRDTGKIVGGAVIDGAKMLFSDPDQTKTTGGNILGAIGAIITGILGAIMELGATIGLSMGQGLTEALTGKKMREDSLRTLQEFADWMISVVLDPSRWGSAFWLVVDAVTGNKNSTSSERGKIFGHASGGRMFAGEVGIVGERRPELWIPDRPGTIYPSIDNSRAFGPNTYNFNINGARDPRQTALEVRRILRQGI